MFVCCSAIMIRQLERETVQLLSCSQVITSIESAVKELVENALDADATNITVRLENFGLDLIEVKDNGKGVKQQEVSAMVKPHCTSKISSFQNLNSLDTYGFRGEALYSLMKMSKFRVTTRTANDPVATSYEFTGAGEVSVSKSCPGDPGTAVSLSGLFNTVPVRRQYYKNKRRCKESLKKIEEYLLAFGLAHPSVRFQLRHDSHTLWLKPQRFNFEENAAEILGVECVQKLAPLNYQCFDPMIKIKALVPTPQLAELSGIVTRATGDRLIVLVNKRPVTIKPITQLVKQAVSTAFPSLGGRYPVAVVMVTVLPQAVDVNLDPNKTTVLLHDLTFIVDTLQSLLEQLYSVTKVVSAVNRSSSTSGGTKNGNEICQRDFNFNSLGCHEHTEPRVGCAQLRGESVSSEDSSGRCDSNPIPDWGNNLSTRNSAADNGRLRVLRDEDYHRVDTGGRVGGDAGGRERYAPVENSDSQLSNLHCHHDLCNEVASMEPVESCDCSHISEELLEPMNLEEFCVESHHKARSEEESIGDSNRISAISHGVTVTIGGAAMTTSGITTSSSGATMATSGDINLCGVKSGPQLSPRSSLSQWSRGCNRQLYKQPVELCVPKPTSPKATSSIGTSSTAASATPLSVAPSSTSVTPPSRTGHLSRFVQSKLTQKRSSPIYDLVNSVPVKRKKVTTVVRPADQNFLKTTPITREPRPTQSMYCTADSSIEFDLNLMKCRMDLMSSHSASDCSDLIGWCDLAPIHQDTPCGVWLVQDRGSVAVFNANKAHRDINGEVGCLDRDVVQNLLSKCRGHSSYGHYLHVFHKLRIRQKSVNTN